VSAGFAGTDNLLIGQARTAMIDAIARGLHDAGISYTLPSCAAPVACKQDDGSGARPTSLVAGLDSQADANAGVALQQQQQQQQATDEAMFAAAAALTTINAQQQQ
jgi:hypothetical protein